MNFFKRKKKLVLEAFEFYFPFFFFILNLKIQNTLYTKFKIKRNF